MSSRVTSALLETLFDRLQSHEDLELEVKRARGGLPQDLWPTIAAFANTQGGWIVLGVDEHETGFTVEGVKDALGLLQTFHGLIRNAQKISYPVCSADDASIEQVDGGKRVIVLRVPSAPRKARPVYVNGNPYAGTYVRRHAGDFHCLKQEVDRMMREASDASVDSTVLRGYTLDDLDREALAGYRRQFQTANPTSAWNRYDDIRFLQAIGGYRLDRERSEEGITVAGLLLLGMPEAIRAWRTRHLIDFRLLSGTENEGSERRWEDRVVWEGHLLGAFEALYPRLVEGLPVPFRLQGATRVAESPAHIALREALVNLLVHADYSETAASLILRFPDGYTLRNPGSSRIPESDLLRGDQSDPRNPELVRMFRMVGLAEEAGTGMSKILHAWRELGFRLPGLEVSTERYEFKLTLRHAHLLDESDRVWLNSMGGTWSEAEQLALVWARREGEIDNVTLRNLTGEHPADITRVLVSLRDRGLLRQFGAKRGARYRLGVAASGAAGGRAAVVATGLNVQGSRPSLGHSEPSLGHSEPSPVHSEPSPVHSGESPVQRSAQVQAQLQAVAAQAQQHARLSPSVLAETVVLLCATAPLTLDELAALLHRNEGHVRRVIRSLLAASQLSYLYPEQPSHPRQRYVAAATRFDVIANRDEEEPSF